MQKQNFIPHIISAAIFIALEIAALSMLRNSGELQDIWISRVGHGVMKGLWGSGQKISNYFSDIQMANYISDISLISEFWAFLDSSFPYLLGFNPRV